MVIRYGLRSMFAAVAVISVAALAGKYVFEWDRQLASEYATADVIREVQRFVESHNGEWPRSWTDISSSDFDRKYVRVSFSVSAEELITDPQLIYTVIVPVSGVYYTYPHAERQLRELLNTIKRFRQQLKKQAQPILP